MGFMRFRLGTLAVRRNRTMTELEGFIWYCFGTVIG